MGIFKIRKFKQKEVIEKQINWNGFKPYQPWEELEKLKSKNQFNEDEKEKDSLASITVKDGGRPSEVEPGKLWGRRIYWRDE